MNYSLTISPGGFQYILFYKKKTVSKLFIYMQLYKSTVQVQITSWHIASRGSVLMNIYKYS